METVVVVIRPAISSINTYHVSNDCLYCKDHGYYAKHRVTSCAHWIEMALVYKTSIRRDDCGNCKNCGVQHKLDNRTQWIKRIRPSNSKQQPHESGIIHNSYSLEPILLREVRQESGFQSAAGLQLHSARRDKYSRFCA